MVKSAIRSPAFHNIIIRIVHFANYCDQRFVPETNLNLGLSQ